MVSFRFSADLIERYRARNSIKGAYAGRAARRIVNRPWNGGPNRWGALPVALASAAPAMTKSLAGVVR